MIQQIEKQKKQLWYKRNNIDENFDYIETLLKNYNIEKWHLTIVDFRIQHRGKTYRIEVDEDIMGIKLFEINIAGNDKLKEYWHLVNKAGENGIFFGDDIWLELVNFIYRRGKKYASTRVS